MKVTSSAKQRQEAFRCMDCVSVGGPVDLMCSVHRLCTERSGRVLHQGDVIAHFHAVASGGFNAGIGHKAHQDDVFDSVLLELSVQVGICKGALCPVFMNDHVT